MDHGFGVAVAPQDTLDLQTPQSSGEFGWGGAFSTMCVKLPKTSALWSFVLDDDLCWVCLLAMQVLRRSEGRDCDGVYDAVTGRPQLPSSAHEAKPV